MSLEPLAPGEAAERLVTMSADVRSAVLIDPAGGLVSASDDDSERARRLAGLAHEMVSAVDSATTGATDALEAQTLGGAVFAVRDARYTLACVARRLALPALVVYDLRQTMLALEGSASAGQLGPRGTQPDPGRSAARSLIGEHRTDSSASSAPIPPGERRTRASR